MKSDTITIPEQNMTLERLKGLYELIGRMNSVYNLQELLEFVMDRALSLTGGHRGVLLLSDDQELTLQDVAVIQGETLQEKDLERILKFVSATVVKDVLARGEPRKVADLHTDKRYEGMTSDQTLRFKNIRSVLAVPLKTEEQLVGLIYIDHPRGGIFGQGDLDFLHAFANQAALAINRAREHQHQIKELTLLNELSRSVVRVLDLNEVLTRIVTEVTQILNVESSSVLLLDETNSDLTFATSVSNGKHIEISTRLSKEQGIAGWVITQGEPVCVNDVTQDPRWFGEVETGFVTHSLLCVPLQIDGRVLGVLEALNKKGSQGFLSGDITLLSAFAASATIAIENARLFQEARQARQLRALNEVAMTLSSTLDLNKILDQGLEQSLTILKAEAGAVNLIDDDTQTDLLTMQLGHDISCDPARADRQTRALSRVTAWMLARSIDAVFADETIVVDSNHPEYKIEDLNLSDSGIEALVAAPLRVSGTISGAIAIVSLKPHTYTLEEISLLNGIARIIGLAAQNAIHYLQTQTQTEHLRYLNEIGSALTRSLDVGQVLKIVIEGVNTLLQTELTSVFLIDDDTNELVLSYSTKNDTEIRLPPGQGIAGWVALEDKPALVNNTQSDPRHLRRIAIETGYEAHSILCVPLKVEGQVIGVVEVLNKIGGQQFDHYHQAMLTELTRWAAIALHNARLFDERGQAYEHLNAEQQRRIAAEARGAMAAVILDMAHTMNNVVGAIRVWASMLKHAIDTTPQDQISKFDKAIGQIRQNAEEALKLMGTMTGPLEVAVITPTNVHNCLDAAVKSCWHPDNIDIIKSYGEDIPLVMANVERLEAAFLNLISNAVQAMATQQGGKIQIRTCRNEASWVKVIVADNGPGIPQELQERVFNPGVSGKERGLGIGLWLVETFIRQFNGRIDFASSAKGTTFTITLQPVDQ